MVTRHNYEFDCDWLAHECGLPRLMAYCVIDYNRLRLDELEFTPLGLSPSLDCETSVIVNYSR